MIEAGPPPIAVPGLATLVVANGNLLNLAAPGHVFHPNQEPCERDEYERKTDWLGATFGRVNAHVMGVQEVWDESALKSANVSAATMASFARCSGCAFLRRADRAARRRARTRARCPRTLKRLPTTTVYP